MPPKQNTNNNYSDAFKPRKKNIVFFSDSISENLKMKIFNAAVSGGRVHRKSFPGSKAVQLNHHTKPTLQEYTYDAAIIHVGINDILRCKNDEELKELLIIIMKIAHTCEEYNIGKIFISSIATCIRTFANIAKINEDTKKMCISNNFEFIAHNQIAAKDLWKDNVHLTESGKVFLARNSLDRITIFFCLETQSS